MSRRGFGRRTLWMWTAVAAAAILALPGHAAKDAVDKLYREAAEGNAAGAAELMRKMARGKDDILDEIPESLVRRTVDELEAQGRETELIALLAALTAPAESPGRENPFRDALRVRHAKLLYQSGNVDGARRIVGTLETPAVIASASLDPRLRRFFPSDPDLRAAAERRLARHREQANESQKKLAPVVLAARDLLLLGRAGEAVDLLRSVETRVLKPGKFKDGDEWRGAWSSVLGRALAENGKYRQAVAALSRGAARDANGTRDMIVLLDLATLQTKSGAGRDALETLSLWGNRGVPSSADVQMRAVRACALALTGRRKDAGADMEFVRAHAKLSPLWLRNMHLCMGDIETASAAFIAHLKDPEESADALLHLSDFDEPPASAPKDPCVPRLSEIRRRADVRAAIAAAGGTRRFDVQRVH